MQLGPRATDMMTWMVPKIVRAWLWILLRDLTLKKLWFVPWLSRNCDTWIDMKVVIWFCSRNIICSDCSYNFLIALISNCNSRVDLILIESLCSHLLLFPTIPNAFMDEEPPCVEQQPWWSLMPLYSRYPVVVSV